jgi:F0F1-type ATP synthase assembly protein I
MNTPTMLKKLIWWPLAINALLILLFWGVEDFAFAKSFAAGAFVCWFANIVYAIPLLRKIAKRSSKRFLLLYYFLEALKLLLYAVLFIVALVVWRLFFEPMLVGFILNLCAYWLIFMMSLGDR